MRTLRTPLALVASVIMGLFTTGGCGRHSKSETYYLISNNLRLPYWKTVDAGFVKAAAEYGVTAQLRGPDTYDAQAELAEFRKAVASKPAGILISVADAALMREDINSAVSANVPVITVDSDAPTSQRLYFIGTNNLAAGRLGAQRLVEKLHGKGNVVFFSIPGQPNLDERQKGYIDVFTEHPQMKIIDTFNIRGEAGAAFDRTEQLLAKTGADKIDAFVSLESSSGKAVAEVLKRHNATDRVLIAMDVDPETLNGVKGGEIEATVSQKPYTMGYVGLKALAEIHQYLPHPFRTNYAVDTFAPYPSFVDTGTALVDKDNVDLYLQNASDAEKR